ncbi:MAG: hypothetical protein ABIR15_18685 [Chitinophagaceae bacterium]
MRYIIPNDKTSVAWREPVRNHSRIHNLIEWFAGQDKQHQITWTDIFLLAATGVLFPLTMAFIVLNNGGFPFIITAMAGQVLVFVLNIAAMSTRYKIPAFFLGILIDAAIIITSIFY